MTQPDDLVEIANRISRPLELLLDYLAEGIDAEHQRCMDEGIDPAADSATFAANVRRRVFERMRPHLPLPAKAAMSPLHFDLGPYQLKALHADDGCIPRPRTAARKWFYRRNELGIRSMNVALAEVLVEVSDEIDEIEDGSLVLVWDYLGPDLVQADLYRPPLTDFPGSHLNLLADTVIEVEEDFPTVRKDEDTGTDDRAATGTDDADAEDPPDDEPAEPGPGDTASR